MYRFLPLALLAAVFAAPGLPAQAQGLSYNWGFNLRNEGSATLPAGSSAGYVIDVFNDSATPAPATQIVIPVPAGTTFDGASGSITGCVLAPADTVTCAIPPLGQLGEASLTIAFLTTTTGVITVTPSIPAPDANPANNSETVTTTIVQGADIALTLSGTASTPSGASVSHSFTATNSGPFPSQGFTVEFPVPAGLDGVVAPAGCTLAGGVYACRVGTALAVGGSVDFVFSSVATSAANSTITLSGSVLDASPPDPDAGNDTATFSTTVTAGSDLRITKTRAPAGPLVVGDAVTFTLAPRYNGDVPNGLTVTDTLPANYSVTSVTATGGWLCTPGQTVTCDLTSGSAPGFNVSLGQITI